MTTNESIKRAALALATAATTLANLITEDAAPAPVTAPAKPAKPAATLPAPTVSAARRDRANSATRAEHFLERTIAGNGWWISLSSSTLDDGAVKRFTSRQQTLLNYARRKGVKIKTKVRVSESGNINLYGKLVKG